MRVRRIAVLIDGAFFLKRLPRLVEAQFCTTPQQVSESARHLCKQHVLRLVHGAATKDPENRWLDHVYRLFYYDAEPFEGMAHHPLMNRQVDFSKSEVAAFRKALFVELRRKRKFALRLGQVTKAGDWTLSPRLTRQMLKTGRWLERLDTALQRHGESASLSQETLRELHDLLNAWRRADEHDVSLGLRQKGVDMRIGLDIASMTLKHQADTIILVAGDSDFAPAAEFARREGAEFLLDPLGQQVSDELTAHVDGIVSVLPSPDRDPDVRIAA